MKKLFILTLALTFSLASFSQNIAITDDDGYTADPSAMLDIKSTTSGMLVPRMTTLQRDAISSPANGLLVFDIDEVSFFFYNGAAWVNLSSGNPNNIWSKSGSDIYLNDTTWNMGIGTKAPIGKLEVKGDVAVTSNDPLFEVINSNGDTVFAVYSQGVRINVADDPAIKAAGSRGGFAVGGFSLTKGLTNEYLRVTPDSVRVYIEDDAVKAAGSRGGFAVGGFSLTKGLTNDYLCVSDDSVRVYIDENGGNKASGSRGGFAVGGFSLTKSTPTDYFNISGADSAEVINPSEARIVWYPTKKAMLSGQVLIESVDSVGTMSIASGNEPKAIGDFSQAFGNHARAFGDNSTAIGNYAQAIGENSYAFGNYAISNDSASYAIGSGAVASGLRSFALGSTGIDSAGVASSSTRASGDYAYAFGAGSEASGQGAFAFGTQDTAAGDYSIAMGCKTEANGWYSTAMGYETHANNDYSTAIGYRTFADSTYATAIGKHAYATGYSSVAIGDGVRSEGMYSLCMGSTNTASGNMSTVLGSWSNATAAYAMAFGFLSNSTAQASIALGAWNNATGSYSTTFGAMSTASGLASIAGGTYCTAGGDYSTAMGYEMGANGNYSFGIGLNDPATPYEITLPNTMAIMGGNVGIGTVTPDKVLHVAGDARVEGDLYYGAGAAIYTKPDFVFSPGYEYNFEVDYIEEFIRKNGHLPWVTAAKDEKDGVNITRMAFETLESAENQQLQIIDLKKENRVLQKNVDILKKENNLLNARISKIESILESLSSK